MRVSCKCTKRHATESMLLVTPSLRAQKLLNTQSANKREIKLNLYPSLDTDKLECSWKRAT